MTTPKYVSAGRSSAIDHARGIGISLVVIGHTLRGLRAAELLPDARWLAFTDGFIYAFHMPLFFLLSGWFAERSLALEPRAFVRGRFDTIVYPYMIWAGLQTVFQIVMSRYANHPATYADLLAIAYRPPMQFWFLYALFLVQCANYALARLGLGVRTRFVIALAANFWALHPGGGFGPWMPLQQTAIYAPYFVAGAWLGPRLSPHLPSASMPFDAVVAVVGFAFVGTTVAWFDARVVEHDWALPIAACGIASTLALASLLARVPKLARGVLLGQHSLEIFVMHTLVSAGARIVLVKVLHLHDAALHLVVGTLLGLFVPLLFAVRVPTLAILFRPPARASRARAPLAPFPEPAPVPMPAPRTGPALSEVAGRPRGRA